MRRILKHHLPALISSKVSNKFLIVEMLKMVETLRSSLAKNAMITIADMLRVFKRELDVFMEIIITSIIKKGMDKNFFLLAEVKNVLL